MFCAPGIVFEGVECVGSRFHVLRDAECIGSRFHVLRSRTSSRRYLGRLILFSCFARPDSFTAVPMASGPVFMFCAPGVVFGGTDGVVSSFYVSRSWTSFGGTEGVLSRFHVFRSRTYFWGYRERRFPFTCYARPDSFSTVPRASAPVFMFCAPRLVFDGSEGVGSRVHVLRARTHFGWYGGRWVPFSCFARPDTFWAVPRTSGLVFMFGAPRLIFSCTEGVVSRYHVLRARTRFRRYRGRRVPISCFARRDSFFAVPRASGPVFMFCLPGLVLGGTEGVGSHFHVLRARTRSGRCRQCQISFSCFELPNSFSAIPRESCLVFMFYAPGIVLCGSEGVDSRFHVLRTPTRFRRYRWRRVPFSCFAPGFVFDGTKGVGSRFHVLRAPPSSPSVPRA
jgi:hypothetical protein